MVAQQREAVTRGRSLLPYRLRYKHVAKHLVQNTIEMFSLISFIYSSDIRNSVGIS
ncbi:MAG: hypothetical protein LBL62_02455 [Planctomycetaceae bacterium]|nr:hypothetical protein [Planctomycetaceae bacterium]